MENEIEFWKDVIGFEGLFMVSNLGRVKGVERTIKVARRGFRLVRESIFKCAPNNSGYLTATLSKGGKSKSVFVHRLVAETFIVNPNLLSEVNHINGNKQDNRAVNLEWISHSGNQQHAYKAGLNSSKCKPIKAINPHRFWFGGRRIIQYRPRPRSNRNYFYRHQ